MIQLALSVSMFKDIHVTKDMFLNGITHPIHPSSSIYHCSSDSSTHHITGSKYSIRSSIDVKGDLLNRFIHVKTKGSI